MEIFGVSTLTVLNNVDLTINLVNGTSCYVTNKYNCILTFFFLLHFKMFQLGNWLAKSRKIKKSLILILSSLTLYILISFNMLHTVALTFGTDKENLFDNQELLKLVIISYILITFTFESRLIL